MPPASAKVLMPIAAGHFSATDEVKLDLAAEVLQAGSPLQVRVVGTSMLPSIWPGDLVSVEHCEPAGVAVGDVIRFMESGRIVIHRVIETRRNGDKRVWLTRGDGACYEDRPVEESQFLGRVFAIRRKTCLIPFSPKVSPFDRCLGRSLNRCAHLQTIILRVRAWLRYWPAAGCGMAKT